LVVHNILNMYTNMQDFYVNLLRNFNFLHFLGILKEHFLLILNVLNVHFVKFQNKTKVKLWKGFPTVLEAILIYILTYFYANKSTFVASVAVLLKFDIQYFKLLFMFFFRWKDNNCNACSVVNIQFGISFNYTQRQHISY